MQRYLRIELAFLCLNFPITFRGRSLFCNFSLLSVWTASKILVWTASKIWCDPRRILVKAICEYPLVWIPWNMAETLLPKSLSRFLCLVVLKLYWSIYTSKVTSTAPIPISFEILKSITITTQKNLLSLSKHFYLKRNTLIWISIDFLWYLLRAEVIDCNYEYYLLWNPRTSYSKFDCRFASLCHV